MINDWWKDTKLDWLPHLIRRQLCCFLDISILHLKKGKWPILVIIVAQESTTKARRDTNHKYITSCNALVNLRKIMNALYFNDLQTLQLLMITQTILATVLECYLDFNYLHAAMKHVFQDSWFACQLWLIERQKGYDQFHSNWVT